MDKLLKILNIISAIGSTVAIVEQTAGAGTDKEADVKLAVTRALQASELVVHRDIVDEKKFWKGIKKINDGIVEVLNSSVWHKP